MDLLSWSSMRILVRSLFIDESNCSQYGRKEVFLQGIE